MPKKRRAKPKKARKKAKRVSNRRKLSVEEERTLFLKEQTILAKERTILSFMRTGLTFVTVGLALVAVSPMLSQGFKVDPWVSLIIGSGIAGMGFFEIIESLRRLRVYKTKMREVTQKLGEDSI